MAIKTALFISAFYVVINLLSSGVFAAIVINEIMYDFIGNDEGHEWVEIYNTGNESVDLTNWKFFEADTNHGLTIKQGNASLDSEEYAIIADNWETFLLDYPTYNKTLFDSSWSSLRNTGESLALKNSSGDIVENVTYSNSWGGEDGKSLERIDALGDSNVESNWAESDVVNGTPGYRNSVTPELTHDLSISSSLIFFDPIDPSPRTGVNITATISNNGLSNETNINISFYNISNEISSYIGSKYINSSVYSSANVTIQWNNTALGNHTILVSITNFTNDENTTNNNATKSITFDFHLVINEVMYNPPQEIGSDVDYEYIELYNNATYTENLTFWYLECDNKVIDLEETLSSGDYLVLAKDTTEFYNYYSQSISTQSQTCSLNNDGDTIKLVFNDSVIYYSEELTYSPSWGADGTGYSLEKIFPNSTNTNNWAESKAYSGTPGAKNNPDTTIKSSLADPSTTVIYRTYTETIYSNKTEENPDYKIVSLPDVVYINEPFKAIVSLRSSEEQIVTVYSYVYDGKKILSEGFDGNNWKGTWTANKKDIKIGLTPVYAEFENKIKSDTPPGKYHFRVRIKEETDLTKIIEVLPERNKTSLTETNLSTETDSGEQLNIECEQTDTKVRITINSSTKKSILLLHFSKEPTKNETLNVNGNLTHTVNLEDGYNSIILLENDKMLASCSFSLENPLQITGRTTQTFFLSNLVKTIISWLKSLIS